MKAIDAGTSIFLIGYILLVAALSVSAWRSIRLKERNIQMTWKLEKLTKRISEATSKEELLKILTELDAILQLASKSYGHHNLELLLTAVARAAQKYQTLHNQGEIPISIPIRPPNLDGSQN